MKKNKIPIIPREVLMGNPEKANIKLSPDGKYISFLAPLDGVLNIFISENGDLENSHPVTTERGRGIRWYEWTFRSGVIIYRMDTDGDENFHIYSLNIRTQEINDRTPFESINAQLMHMTYRHPDALLLGINKRDPRWHDVYSLSLKTDELVLLHENDGFKSFQFDPDMNLVSGFKPLNDGGLDCLLWKNHQWERLFEVGADDSLTTHPLGIDANDTMWLAWSLNRNTSALASIDLVSRQRKIHAEHPNADLHPWIVHHPVTLQPQAAVFDYLRREYFVLDDSIRFDINYLENLYRGDFRIADRSLDDSIWLIEYYQDIGSQRYFLYFRKERMARELCAMRPELDALKLSRLHPVVIPASDGLELVCYYTLPQWHDNPEGKAPEEPLPAVLVVHGGPWGRNRWRFNPIHQLYANRGYFVLSVNFRASTGFGKEHINAGNGEWSRKMHKDLLDAVEWSVTHCFADEKRIAILGASYGGYAALVGMTFTPEVFACGVDLFGPANLVTLLSNLPPYWEDIRSRFRNQIGALPDTEEGREFLMDRSPISRVGNICRPLLIGQGANDPRVSKDESDQIASSMRDKGLPVTYLLYPDEGHGFGRPENRLSFYAVAEKFLAKHIGGRYQPIGDCLKNSSARIVDPGNLEGI